MNAVLPSSSSMPPGDGSLLVAPGAPPTANGQCGRGEMPIENSMRCPACRGPLSSREERRELQRNSGKACLTCRDCERRYPVVDGAPILIHEENSVFTIEHFVRRGATFFKPVGSWRAAASRCAPTLSVNVAARKNFARLREMLLANGSAERPRVLVVGGSIVGAGAEELVNDDRMELVETDVAWGPRTQLICDAHDLPFADESFDAVVAQAVLEHVLDPRRCVREIERVLKPAGLVYADTPFMQQVHGREFDFTRWTRLGHRWMFRNFAEVESGITCGPGMALAWSARYFLLSWFASPRLRAVASGAARILFGWLPYLDYLSAKRPAALDAASAFYFLGRKSEHPLAAKELLANYRGGF